MKICGHTFYPILLVYGAQASSIPQYYLIATVTLVCQLFETYELFHRAHLQYSTTAVIK